MNPVRTRDKTTQGKLQAPGRKDRGKGGLKHRAEERNLGSSKGLRAWGGGRPQRTQECTRPTAPAAGNREFGPGQPQELCHPGLWAPALLLGRARSAGTQSSSSRRIQRIPAGQRPRESSTAAALGAGWAQGSSGTGRSRGCAGFPKQRQQPCHFTSCRASP